MVKIYLMNFLFLCIFSDWLQICCIRRRATKLKEVNWILMSYFLKNLSSTEQNFKSIEFFFIINIELNISKTILNT